MRISNKLWIIQNRFWLKNALVVATLSILLLALAVKTLPDLFSCWSPFANSQRPTLAELEGELAVERIRSLILTATLDSLKSAEEEHGAAQTALTAIRERCDLRHVSLTGFERVQQGQRTNANQVSYRLLMDGKFHAMTLLLSDLEALPHDLTVQSFVLERKTQDTEKIRGVFLVNIGVI